MFSWSYFGLVSVLMNRTDGQISIFRIHYFQRDHNGRCVCIFVRTTVSIILKIFKYTDVNVFMAENKCFLCNCIIDENSFFVCT